MMEKEKLEDVLEKVTENVQFDYEVDDEHIRLNWVGGDSGTEFRIDRDKVENASDLMSEVLSIHTAYDFRGEAMSCVDSVGDGINGAPPIDDLLDECRYIEDELSRLHDNLIDMHNGNVPSRKKCKWELSIMDENGNKISFLNLDSRYQRDLIRFLKANYEKGEIEIEE